MGITSFLQANVQMGLLPILYSALSLQIAVTGQPKFVHVLHPFLHVDSFVLCLSFSICSSKHRSIKSSETGELGIDQNAPFAQCRCRIADGDLIWPFLF